MIKLLTEKLYIILWSADLRAKDSPKKGTNKFGFFAMKSKKQKTKTCLFLCFWETLQRANLLMVLSDLYTEVATQKKRSTFNIRRETTQPAGYYCARAIMIDIHPVVHSTPSSQGIATQWARWKPSRPNFANNGLFMSQPASVLSLPKWHFSYGSMILCQ